MRSEHPLHPLPSSLPPPRSSLLTPRSFPPMLLFTHPTGNANVRHAAVGLHRAGCLREFWTCLHLQPPSVVERILPAKVKNQLNRRRYPDELNEAIRTRPLHEAIRLFAPHVGLHKLVQHETGRFSVDSVYRALDRAVARRLRSGDFDGVYAYEDGAEFSFAAAREHGLSTFYDLPIGYWRAARKLLVEEAELQPEWASTLVGNHDSAAKTDRKDAELAQADVVFVASTFTRKTLEDAAPFNASIVVVPYGAPRIQSITTPVVRPSTKRLRVLFVGSLGQRKGLSYLFDACKRLPHAVELTVIGRRPFEACPALDRELRRVRWIPTCSHAEVLAEMAAHDVFVFPSLFEGFGLVLLEAMAMGLPVITTAHTAGPDLLRHGIDGFIVPIRDSVAIARHLELLHREPDRRAEMSRESRLRAARFTWNQYEETLAACVSQALSNTAAVTT